MSTIPVQYGLRVHRAKATPGMRTSELLERACAHFQLSPLHYGLFYNDKELPTPIPLRLQNLPNGAKLTIKRSKAAKNPEINLKIQFTNNPSLSKTSVVKKVMNTITVRELMTTLEADVGKILDTGLVINFATLGKVLGEEVLDMDLAQIGAENNGVLRVSFKDPNAAPPPPLKKTEPIVKKPVVPTPTEENPTPSRSEVESTATTTTSDVPKPQPLPQPESPSTTKEDNDDKMDIDAPEPSPLPKPTPLPTITKLVQEQPPQKEDEEPAKAPEKHVYVYKTPTAPIVTNTPDEATYELSVDQARHYQNMIHLRATETEKARKVRIMKQKHALINVECRIRFPDGSNVQVNFKPDDECKELYSFVSGCLLKEEKFELIVPHPKNLIPNDSSLMRDWLESRNFLLFHCSNDKRSSYLKQEYLDQAKEITEAEDIKLDQEEGTEMEDVVEEQSTIKSGVLPKSQFRSLGGNGDDSGKKIPKWLKLGLKK